MHTILIVE